MKKKSLINLSILLTLYTLVTFTQFTPVQAASKMKIVSTTKHYCAPLYDSKGTVAELKVQGAGSQKITWKSSNSRVVSVSKTGVITVHKMGAATITAKVGKTTLKHYVEAFERHDFATSYCSRCKNEAPSWLITRADTQKQLKDLVFSIVTPNMTVEEKIVALNDWFAENMKYEFRNELEYKYDKHGQRIPRYCNVTNGLAAWNGGGQCQELAESFFIMAYTAGLEVRVYGGNHDDGTPGHAWNIVKVDGMWYVYDPTGAVDSNHINTNLVNILKPIDLANLQYVGIYRITRCEIGPLYNANYITSEQRDDLYYDKNPIYPYLIKNN